MLLDLSGIWDMMFIMCCILVALIYLHTDCILCLFFCTFFVFAHRTWTFLSLSHALDGHEPSLASCHECYFYSYILLLSCCGKIKFLLLL